METNQPSASGLIQEPSTKPITMENLLENLERSRDAILETKPKIWTGQKVCLIL